MKVAIIGGSGFKSERFLKGFSRQIIKTMYGNVLLYQKGKSFFLPRHGKGANIPPHRINHKANICALNLLGVENILSINSVGSLSQKIKPGTFILPDDYVNFNPDTFFELELKSITPEINEKVRKEIKDCAKKAKVAVKDKAVYVQTKGPRFETKAEIRVISKWGDIVGMTMASEATLAQELAIPYAALCVVDNYANGIGKGISQSALAKSQKQNLPKAERIAIEFLKRNG